MSTQQAKAHYAMHAPRQAVLVREISIEPVGGADLELADIDGDGELELLILQSPGQFKSSLFAGFRSGVDAVDQSLYCLTAMRMSGEVLWQNGEPYNREFPYATHGSGQQMKIEDVDGDGRLEIILVTRGNELKVLDAATGCAKATAQLPTDNFGPVFTARLDGDHTKQIICKVNCKTYEPWDYANPVIVFNSDLTARCEPFAVKGAGHNVVALDVDGDGCDELLIGYSLFDHDLRELWTIEMPAGFDYAREHIDHIGVVSLSDEGSPCVLYSGSKDFFVTDLKGQTLWKSEAGHSQQSVVGRWAPTGETRIVMMEKWRGLTSLDASGQIRWQRSDINGYVPGSVRWSRDASIGQWGLFAPQLKPMRETPYWSDPAWSRDLWPRFIDADGQLHDVFPWHDDYAHPRQWIRLHRAYDCGITYSHQGTNAAIIRDLDGDGLDEVVLHNRQRVWIFRSPEA